METADTSDFDFEYWANLWKMDPTRAERERKDVVGAVIAKAPEHLQRRLVGLQWQIDMERSRASNPLSACIRLNKMMMDFAWSDQGFPRMNALFGEIKAKLLEQQKVLAELQQITSPPKE